MLHKGIQLKLWNERNIKKLENLCRKSVAVKRDVENALVHGGRGGRGEDA